MGERADERDRTNQVRCKTLQQQASLPECLADQSEVEHLQVTQTAVDQLAGAA